MFKIYNWYAVSRWLHKHNVPILPRLITLFIRFIFASYIPCSADIGKGTVFGYGGLGIVIHGRAVLGSNCHIDQNVTIGGTSNKHDVPILEDCVYIGAGAKVLGPIKIGNNVVIGANAVVVSDVPEGSLVVGIPARVIKSGIVMSDYV